MVDLGGGAVSYERGTPVEGVALGLLTRDSQGFERKAGLFGR